MPQAPHRSYFNPLPHTRENLLRQTCCCKLWHFNPLPHTRENTIIVIVWRGFFGFQSTPSYEGELVRHLPMSPSMTFQSTPSYEGEPSLCVITFQHTKLFQSTPSYEGELIHIGLHKLVFWDFNPLPHTRENPKRFSRIVKNIRISIHSLIRGRTSVTVSGLQT